MGERHGAGWPGGGRHRARAQRRDSYSWLGTGAVALGLGAVLFNGTGVAHADDPSGSGSSVSSTTPGSGNATKSASAHPLGIVSSALSATTGRGSPLRAVLSSGLNGHRSPASRTPTIDAGGVVEHDTTLQAVGKLASEFRGPFANSPSRGPGLPDLVAGLAAVAASAPTSLGAGSNGSTSASIPTLADPQTFATFSGSSVNATPSAGFAGPIHPAETVDSLVPSVTDVVDQAAAPSSASPIDAVQQNLASAVAGLEGMGGFGRNFPTGPVLPTLLAAAVWSTLGTDDHFGTAATGTQASNVTANSEPETPVSQAAVDPSSIALSPDGKRLYAADPSTNTVQILDPNTLKPVATAVPVGDDPGSLVVSPDGNHVYVTNSGDGTVSSIDTRTLRTTTRSVGAEPSQIVVSGDSSRVFVVTDNGANVAVLNSALQPIRAPIPVSRAEAVAVSPDGKTLYVASLGTPSVVDVINVSNARTVGAVPVGSDPTGMAVNQDGSRLYVTDGDGTVRIINTSTRTTVGAPIQAGRLQTPVGAPVLSPDGTRLYVVNYELNEVEAVDVKTGKVTTLGHLTNDYPTDVAVSRDGSKVYESSPSNIYVVPSGASTGGGQSPTTAFLAIASIGESAVSVIGGEAVNVIGRLNPLVSLGLAGTEVVTGIGEVNSGHPVGGTLDLLAGTLAAATAGSEVAGIEPVAVVGATAGAGLETINFIGKSLFNW